MHRAGRVSIYIGIALVLSGLVVGFGAMFMDYDNQAKVLIGLVPIGFVLLLAGTVATQLTPPKDKE